MLVELVLELVRLKLCEPAKPRLSRRRRLAVHHCNSPLSSWRKLYCNHCQPLLTQILQDGYGAYSNPKVFLEKGAWWTASPLRGVCPIEQDWSTPQCHSSDNRG
ncbi:hypothetical protein F443_13201 [Phytophthora nicotianae P1569]|uniref:Uncharacterized protein n=1 Tax=Phytophthora nicotianae P1569 TaxID=1317065 RepID=V9EU31_PHYNI|nr:hypothetical protein F443_13201 [Phytophthora nicotianae P1569]